jgi:hypothetical protein
MDVLQREEHQGANERSYAQIMDFRETMDVCGLSDLGYTGINWAFEKKVIGGSYYRARLDGALGSASWSARYPLAEVHHLAAAAVSDHIPILLKMEPSSDHNQRSPRLLRYEIMWASKSISTDSPKRLLKRIRLIIWGRGPKLNHTHGPKKLPASSWFQKKTPAIPSNSHGGGVLLGAPDTKSCVKNATYPYSAPPPLILFSLERTTGGGQAP